MHLSCLVQAAAGGSEGKGPGAAEGPAAPASAAAPNLPPDAKARAASREAAAKIARAVGSAAEDLDAVPPGAQGPSHKPYSVPPGWKAPTLGEQFRYAALRHPYYRYGYAAAVVMGLLGWAIATEEKGRRGTPAEHDSSSGSSGSGGSSGGGSGGGAG